ncbi:MAG TPA: cupin domain-containing protein [Rhizobiales bacterium]|nr:cupin domain-containing protein [Hyphomicrobiales bacterium]
MMLEKSQGMYVHSPHRLAVACGLVDIVIVDTPDALLVADKNSMSMLADVVDRLKSDKRPEVDVNLRVARPWGHYDVKAVEPGYKVKCVLVRPGEALSNQFHYHRAEHWVVVRGTACVTMDGRQQQVGVNESIFIPKGTVHRLENRTGEALELVEVQTGDYLGEDDIVRVDDAYGRK